MERITVDKIYTEVIPEEIFKEITSPGIHLETKGFQEILLYRGRKIVGSIGGSWKDQSNELFIPDNYGSENFQWNGKHLEEVNPKELWSNTKRDVWIALQYTYPCIAWIEEHLRDGFVVATETKLSSLYPIRKTVQGMESVGEDFWGRETFKDQKNQYYCEVDGALYFKGSDVEGEPHWRVDKEIESTYEEIDKNISRIDPYIEKVRSRIKEEFNLDLISTTKEIIGHPSINKNDQVEADLKTARILVNYTFKF